MEKRLTELEVKMAFLERIQEELNSVVRGLSQDLERVQAQMGRVVDQLGAEPDADPPRIHR